MRLFDLLFPLHRKIEQGYENIEIKRICDNSNYASKDTIFVAINGNKQDGSLFIEDAVMRGARVVITENKNVKKESVLIIYVKNARKALAVLSARLAGNPERKMKIVGVTGTKGKSTTAFLIHKILGRFSEKSVFIGSFGVISDGCKKTENTTPSPIILFNELKLAYERGIRIAIIEVSSQALKDFRVFGIPFFITVFTSLGKDHIGTYEHQSRAEYVFAKHTLFSSYGSQIAVVNGDDAYSSFIASGTPRILKCGFFHHNDVVIEGFTEEREGARFSIGESGVYSSLRGEYNAINATLAILCSCIILKKLIRDVALAASFISIEGRFEEYFVKGKHVVIDYAHTPESFLAVSTLARKLYSSRQIAVFGSVSDRAFARRELLAKAAEKTFDFSIITGDDVSGEEAEKICREIYSHFTDKSRACVINDREKAIKKALEISAIGDTVLLLGKGQERSIRKGKIEVYFNERDFINYKA